MEPARRYAQVQAAEPGQEHRFLLTGCQAGRPRIAAAKARQPVPGPVPGPDPVPVPASVPAMPEREPRSAPQACQERSEPAVPMPVRKCRNALDMRAQAAITVRVRDIQARAARPEKGRYTRPASPGTVPDSQGIGLTEGRESQEAGRENGPGTQAKVKEPGRQPEIWALAALADAHTAGPMQGRKTLAPLRSGIRPLEETGAEQAAAGRPGKRRQRTRPRQRLSAAVR